MLPSGPRDIDDTAMRSDDRDREEPAKAVLGVSFVGALVPAILIGWVVGSLATRTHSCDPQEKWCDLGEFLVAAFTGGLVGFVVYVAVGVVLIVRRRPRGRRAGLIVLHVCLPGLLVVASQLLLAIPTLPGPS